MLSHFVRNGLSKSEKNYILGFNGTIAILGGIWGIASGHPFTGFLSGLAAGIISCSPGLIAEYFGFKYQRSITPKRTNGILDLIASNDFSSDSSVYLVKLEDFGEKQSKYSFCLDEFDLPFITLTFDHKGLKFTDEFISSSWSKHEENAEYLVELLKNKIKLMHKASDILDSPSVETYQDEITQRMDQVLKDASFLLHTYSFDLETTHLLSHALPNDIETIRNLYLSFEDKLSLGESSKVISSLLIFENKVSSLSEMKNLEKLKKLDELHEVFKARYTIGEENE